MTASSTSGLDSSGSKSWSADNGNSVPAQTTSSSEGSTAGAVVDVVDAVVVVDTKVDVKDVESPSEAMSVSTEVGSAPQPAISHAPQAMAARTRTPNAVL
ncbi:MAG: hypothetical protein OEW83_11195 [Acidimicrobiia bacterium]|nr:hypothetical protein [Acidimicrobiia bacterium]